MYILVKINHKLNLFRKKKLALFSKLFYEDIIFITTSMPIEISLVKMSISRIRPTIIRDNGPHISVICEQNIIYHSN